MKCAIVTGASRGIGRAVVQMLIQEDWQVWGLSRTPPGIDHYNFWWGEHDLAGDAPIILGDIPCDALIHCAGVRGPYGPLADVDPDAWAETITTNLLGTYRVVSAALPLLQRSEDGRILLCSGGGAFDAAPGYSAYAASKAGTVALMESLAAELADTTVAVNCVAPGFVATTIHDGTPLAGTPDSGHALSDAVACIRHLLSPSALGLSGRTISAAYDDWSHITPSSVPALMASRMGQRDRVKVQRLSELARYAQRDGVPAGLLAG